MGLPGSGKTYLAKRMQPMLNAAWYNADIVREMANDWDFSPEGRIRQSLRMKSLADFEKKHGRIVICDFVCPTHETKRNFNPDITIWMNTIKSGRYEDTNRMFESPMEVDYEVNENSFGQINYTFTDEMFNSDVFLGTREIQDSYSIVNASWTLVRGNKQLQFYVNNLTDETAELGRNYEDYVDLITVNRPRSIGIKFSWLLDK